MQRCPSCGKQIVRFPISKEPFWEGKPFNSKFNKNALKKENIIWRNVFKIDWLSFFFVVIILYLAWAYHTDLGHFEDALNPILEDPCGWCEQRQQYCMQQKLSLSFDVEPFDGT